MPEPSSARRIAWLRFWPRPAPVMKATLPSTLPAIYGPGLTNNAVVGEQIASG
jgi:hypothetical protein